MTRWTFVAMFAAITTVGAAGRTAAPAGQRSDSAASPARAPCATGCLAGRWSLDRELSQFPREIGFGTDVVAAGLPGAAPTGGGGRRGRGATSTRSISPIPARPESEDDAGRRRQLTAEVQTPPANLTIVQTPASVTITDDRGRSRTFHPGGKEDILQLDGVPVAATERWEADRLVIRYQVSEGRELRYTFSRSTDPPQLLVDVLFAERGGHDSVRHVYTPASATETQPAAAALPLPTTTPATAPPQPPIASDGSKAGLAAPADRPQSPIRPQQPDAELRGLTKVGSVVEQLSSQAAACGLSQTTLETTVRKSLSDAGLQVLRNSDEDTYVYVHIITSTLSNGLCVSRYDVSLYSYTTATLSHHTAPLLVQVELLHKGGLAGGGTTAHADSVLRGVKEYVDQMAARIRDANK
jgi:hypothetical protein